jgi:glycosyltransferase involved in cell wall biosynthesis
MKSKVYVYGLCNVFYDAYYILGLKELYGDFEFNTSKFPRFKQETFAVIIEESYSVKKIIIDSRDSNEIDLISLEWCDVYGKVNCKEISEDSWGQEKIIVIGPSFGIKIWNIFSTLFHVSFNFCRFKNNISNKREFIANYWRQYNRLRLVKYTPSSSSKNQVFFFSSIWKKEIETNKNRALFIESCKNNSNVIFEGGFAARTNGDNLGYDNLVWSRKIPLKVYLKKTKNSAIAFNTPAVLSCHGWKLAEFLALGKAIITTAHFNKLPVELLNYKHLIYANDSASITKAVDELISNDELRNKIESESRKYFEEFLIPKIVIKRIVNHIKI